MLFAVPVTKREQLERLYGLLPESQGQNLALPVLRESSSIESYTPRNVLRTFTSKPRPESGLV